MAKLGEDAAAASRSSIEEITKKGSEGTAEAIHELVPFLTNSRPEVRKAGVDIVFQLTGSEEGVRELKKTEAPRFLCRLVGDMKKIAEPALKALINLSADTEIIAKLLKYGIITSVINFLSEEENENKRLVLMLLANVSVSEAGARKLLQIDGEQLQGLHVRRLVRWYLENKPDEKIFPGIEWTEAHFKEIDPWQYVANILANVTQVQEGRDLVRRRSTNIVKDVIPELTSPNPVRRRGIAATLKNVCFIQDDHWHYYAELDLIPHLLYPLAGPEQLDEEDKMGMSPILYRDGAEKVREPDATVRRLLIEILLLFCTTRAGRKVLRKQKAYPIIRNAHLVESDDEVGEEFYKVVDFLIRDEEGEAPNLEKLEKEALEAQKLEKVSELSLNDKEGEKKALEEEEDDDDEDDDLPDLVPPSRTSHDQSSVPSRSAAMTQVRTPFSAPSRQEHVEVDELD